MNEIELSSIPQYNKEKQVIELVDKDGNVIVELNRDMAVSISLLMDRVE